MMFQHTLFKLYTLSSYFNVGRMAYLQANVLTLMYF